MSAPGGRIWLLRHGESTWNRAGRWQGHADPPLTALGREQARRAAGRLARRGIELIVSSDLRRARETAGIVAEALALPVRLDADLRELDVGCWSGLAHPEIEARWPEAYQRFRSADPAAPAGGAESREVVARRAQRALQRLVAAAPGPTVAVTHSGVIRSLVKGASPANGELVELRTIGAAGDRAG